MKQCVKCLEVQDYICFEYRKQYWTYRNVCYKCAYKRKLERFHEEPLLYEETKDRIKQRQRNNRNRTREYSRQTRIKKKSD